MLIAPILSSKSEVNSNYFLLLSFIQACLVTPTGEKFTGCNVENASYGLSICAERTALVKAVSAGFTKFSAIAVASNLEKEISPCGAWYILIVFICYFVLKSRQFLAEFGKDIDVIMTTLNGDGITVKSGELIPYTFDL